MFLRGIRGAITVEENVSGLILDATRELLSKLLADNGVEISDIASIFFTVTTDLNAAFPAKAAREMGLGLVPLLCMTEIPVPDGLARCIRILVHWNTTKDVDAIKHVYLREAVVLRPDVCS